MLKLMGKKIFTIYSTKICLSKPTEISVVLMSEFAVMLAYKLVYTLHFMTEDLFPNWYTVSGETFRQAEQNRTEHIFNKQKASLYCIL